MGLPVTIVSVMALMAAPAATSVYDGNGNGGGGKDLGKAIAAQAGNDHLLDHPDVAGTVVGYNTAGEPVVKLYTLRRNYQLPRHLDDVPTEQLVTGTLLALHHRPCHGGGPGGGAGEDPPPTPSTTVAIGT